MYETQSIKPPFISLFVFKLSSMILLAYVPYKKLNLKSSSIPDHTINLLLSELLGLPGRIVLCVCTFNSMSDN